MKSKLSTTKDPDLAAWCAALASVTAPVDIVPRGWFTAAEIAANEKQSHVRTRKKISLLLQAGKIERRSFRIKLGKVVRPVPHYRLLK